jgi:hypothetical protein
LKISNFQYEDNFLFQDISLFIWRKFTFCYEGTLFSVLKFTTSYFENMCSFWVFFFLDGCNFAGLHYRGYVFHVYVVLECRIEGWIFHTPFSCQIFLMIAGKEKFFCSGGEWIFYLEI